MVPLNYRVYCRVLLFLLLLLMVFSQTASGAGEKPLLVRGDKNFAPYEYIDSKGFPAGFTIDTIRAVAREMGLKLEISLGPWDEVRKELENKEIDLLTGVLRSKERERYFDFSIPHSMLAYSLFVRKDSEIQNKEDIDGKDIIVPAEAFPHEWLKKNQVTPHIIPVIELGKGLQLLASGKHDCALIERRSGLEVLRRLNIENVISVGPPILPGKYCFAVAEGNKELMSLLDEGFYNIYKSGEYDRIYRKWFSVYENRLLNATVMKYAASALLVFIVALLLVVCWNIGLKRAVERRTLALKESERKFRELTELLPETVFEINRAGMFKFINRNGLAALGYSSGVSCKGKDVYSLFDVESKKKVEKEIRGALEGQIIEPEEYTAIRKDGSTFPVFLYTSLIFRDEKPVGLRCILVDISKIQELENQIQHTRQMESLGRMAGGIAHDFNNMLTGINGYIQLALRQIKEEDKRAEKNLLKALKSSNLAAELVRHIHAFSRQAARRVSSVNLGLVVEEVLQLLSHTLPANITIKQTFGAAQSMIAADPTQIHQVVMNLCINSSHAMAKTGGLLEVGLKDAKITAGDKEIANVVEPGNYLELTVRDTGAGIEPEIMTQIFDPYFTTKPPEAGTGLGLSVVKDIVKTIGGDITVESSPGVGTNFKVLFPIRSRSMTEGSKHVLEERPALNGHILIADDEGAQLEMERSVLESKGYNVIVKPSGQEALNAFMEAPDRFHLVIADQHTPGLGGIELTKKILAIKPSMPVVLCIGFTDMTAEEKAKTAGVRQFLKKPLVKEQVAKLIQEVLNQ